MEKDDDTSRISSEAAALHALEEEFDRWKTENVLEEQGMAITPVVKQGMASGMNGISKADFKTEVPADGMGCGLEVLAAPRLSTEDYDVVDYFTRVAELESPAGGRYLDRLTSEQRKQHPMCEGLLDYFPDALAMVAHNSWLGNEKHNPGEPLHHARGKSPDEADCVIRHMATRDDFEVYEIDGVEYRVPHWVAGAWRLLSYGQKWMEREHNLDLPKGARNSKQEEADRRFGQPHYGHKETDNVSSD